MIKTHRIQKTRMCVFTDVGKLRLVGALMDQQCIQRQFHVKQWQRQYLIDNDISIIISKAYKADVNV